MQPWRCRGETCCLHRHSHEVSGICIFQNFISWQEGAQAAQNRDLWNVTVAVGCTSNQVLDGAVVAFYPYFCHGILVGLVPIFGCSLRRIYLCTSRASYFEDLSSALGSFENSSSMTMTPYPRSLINENEIIHFLPNFSSQGLVVTCCNL